MKPAACAMAVSLLAGAAYFIAPAAAQSAPLPPSHAKMASHHAKKLFMSAVAEYDAGLRRGSAASSRNAYLRGFRDGTSSEAYSVRGYVANPVPAYAIAPVSGYSTYDRDAVYAPATGAYTSYDGRPVPGDADAYGYGNDRDNAGYVPRGLMDVVVAPAPVTATPYSPLRTAQWAYCAARYQSFDPASGTFLANDGYRYECR
jgi:hypothetical protein